MRIFLFLVAIVFAIGHADAFQQGLLTNSLLAPPRRHGPSSRQRRKQNLGCLGPKGFQSRSMQSFQEAPKRGEAAHLLLMMNAKERLAKGEIKPEVIPYMQRDGT